MTRPADMRGRRYAWLVTAALAGSALLVWGLSARAPAAAADSFEVNDVHLHLTNYVQTGTNIRDFVNPGAITATSMVKGNSAPANR